MRNNLWKPSIRDLFFFEKAKTYGFEFEWRSLEHGDGVVFRATDQTERSLHKCILFLFFYFQAYSSYLKFYLFENYIIFKS